MKKITALSLFVLAISLKAEAATTYTYAGSSFAALNGAIVVSFTTTQPLTASTSYLSTSSAGVTQGSLSVVDANGGVLPGFALPLSMFQVHTNTKGAIDSWFILGDGINYTGIAPIMSGPFWQAYTMNTLAFIPGSDIPGAVGLVTGPYDYDQATETTYYTACAAAPAGCVLAGDGQPYLNNYSGIINPSNTTAANWTVSTTGTPPPPPPVTPITISGSLPGGTVNQTYAYKFTITGGKPPYSWSESGLPSGLSFQQGQISGAPTVAGTSALSVTATDSKGHIGHYSGKLTIAPAAVSCNKPTGKGLKLGLGGQGKISAINANVITFINGKGASAVVTVPACAKVELNDATAVKVGQQFEWSGYATTSTGNVAQTVIIN